MVQEKKKRSRLLSAFILTFALLLLTSAHVFATTNTEDNIFQPIEISEVFNQDVIFEDEGDASQGVDNNGSNSCAFYSLPGVGGSLPEGGLIRGTGANNKVFLKLGSYHEKNALKLDKDNPSGTLTFSNPKKYRAFAFMVTGGDGGGKLTIKVYSHENTAVETLDVSVPDWCVKDDNKSDLLYGCGRCSYETGDDTTESGEIFGIYTFQRTLSDSSQNYEINRITFEFSELSDPAKSTACIFGVSGLENSEKPFAIFDSNDGHCDTVSLEADSDNKIKLPAATWQAHDFLGWKAEGSDTLYNTGEELSLQYNTILTAQWDSNENDYVEIPINPKNSVLSFKKLYKKNGVWPDPKRKGYIFNGFTNFQGNSVEKSALVAGTQYQTKWKVNISEVDRINLYVQGLQVTKENCNNILSGDPANNGKVSYDFTTNTLTLKGAELRTADSPSQNSSGLNPSDYIAIMYYQGDNYEDKLGPFTISLIGENTIEDQSFSQGKFSSAIWVECEDLNITGTGSLESNLQNKGITICTINTDLSIQSDLTIHLPKTNGAGISTGTGGSAQSSGKIDITDASVTITADGDAEGSTAIYHCNGITCKNSHVIASWELSCKVNTLHPPMGVKPGRIIIGLYANRETGFL